MPILLKFFWKPVENPERTKAEGRPVFDDEEWVNVRIDEKSEHSMPVDRFWNATERDEPADREWYQRCYQAWKMSEEAPLNGTDLAEWPQVTASRVEECRRVGIRTIEELARATDGEIGKLGPGGRDLQQRAKSWIEVAANQGAASEKIAGLEEENELQKMEIADLKAQVAQLVEESQQRRGTARPRKDAA